MGKKHVIETNQEETIKETRGSEDFCGFVNLKVKLGKLINLPSLKIFSTAFLLALFFLGSI